MYDSVGVIGCGRMGGIILDGIISNQLAQIDQISVSEPSEQLLSGITDKYPGIRTGQDHVLSNSDIFIICVKPDGVAPLLQLIRQHSKPDSVVASIAAGIGLDQMTRELPENRCIRVMPNTPCQVGCGMSVLCPGAGAPKEAVDKLKSIFGALGRTMTLRPDQMDAATALAGSSPGLIFTLLEGLADGGVLMGVPREQSLELVAQSMLGAAQMVLSAAPDKSISHPAVLRDQVCTPGGCTIAGVLTLEDGRVRSTLARAVEATAKKAAELGKK